MKSYSQYEEEKIIIPFFKNKKNGTVIDVGAADGIRYSNSRLLIDEFSWDGILVEPHPTFYSKLKTLYAENQNVLTLNIAIHSQIGKMPFYLYGHNEHAQVSTLSLEFKNRVINVHGDNYVESVIVDVDTLESVLKLKKNCDFLSIDCEGVDMEVLKSNNWEIYRPTLICVEHSMPKDELDNFMNNKNYTLLDRTCGNSFFTSK